KVANALDRKIRSRKRGDDGRIVRVLALARQDCRDPVAPDLFDRRQNARFVVDQDIMTRRVAALDILELLFFVDVDQHIALDRLGDPRALDLAWLKDDVAVGQYYRPPPAAEAFEHIEGPGVEAIGERVVDQVRGHRQEVYVVWMLRPVA